MEHEAAHALPYLREALIFLVAAGVVVPLLQRFGLNPVLGYLVAGVAVGPHGIASLGIEVLGTPLDVIAITDAEGVRTIAELGVVFLLFIIGLELSGPRLWAMRRLVFGLGGAQVVVTGAVLALACHLTGLAWPPSVAIGAALSLSSTAIVVQLLVAAGRFASPPGQVMFPVLLMQDIAVVPILLLIGALGAAEGGLLQRIVVSVGGAVIVIPLILLVGGRVLGPLLRFIGARRDRDMFTAAALLVIIATAATTQMAGLSMALGAFLAGLVFADTEFAHQLEAEIAPFKGLLLGLFFLSVGMTIDPRVFVDAPLALAVVIVGVVAIKAAVMTALAIAFRQPVAVAVESGLMLSQIGEFTLVALALGVTVGVVPVEVARVLVVAAGLTMLLTTAVAPAIFRMGSAIAERGEAERLATTLADAAPEGHVIIAGYGRIGRAIGDLLEERRIPYLALDLNSQGVTRARRTGKPVHFGDVRRTDVLHNARAREARAIVLTMDNAAANATAIASLRQAGIETPVVARARDTANAQELYTMGADEVVLEAFEASLQMGEETLVAIGFPREAAHSVIAEQREAGRRELADSVGAGRRR